MSTQRTQFGKPSAGAMRYVRYYVQRDMRLGDSSIAIPVLARARCLLDLELGDPIAVHSSSTGLNDKPGTAVVVGLETYVQNQLLIRGNFEHFQIHFKPLALNHLLKIPVDELTNRNHAAQAVLGSAVIQLRQRLGEAHTFQQRVQLADQFVAAQWSGAPIHDSIELAANEILRRSGQCRMDALAHHTGFSMRNFQRRFSERVGVSPKLFSRIARFEAALKLKTASPQISWLTIAQECGFHDQMHLIHDFRLFSGETPTGIVVDERAAFELQNELAVLT